MKILIAEDDSTSSLLLRRLLDPYGDCRIVVTGAEAVRAFAGAHNEKEPYDLICLDIMMPEMDGQAALKAIRDLESSGDVPGGGHVRIFMVTALADLKNVMTAYKSLCDAYLVKPVDRIKLRESLKENGLI